MARSERPARSHIRVRAGKGAPPSVDGHPGWVQQSTNQYAALCGVVLSTQGLIAGIGPLLMNARSAAWWCLAVGFLGGVLIWIGVWGLMRGKQVRSLDEALCAAFGKIGGSVLCVVLAALLVFDASVALGAMGGLVRQYLLIGANERIVEFTVIVVIAISLGRHGVRGFSRMLWFFRVILISTFIISMAFLLEDTSLDNLFPLMGNSPGETLAQIPVAASGMAGILLLGLLPKQTGSAKQVSINTGFISLVIGFIGAVGLTLMANLSVPPRVVPEYLAWGHQLMLSAEYNSFRFYRLVYMFVLTFKITIAIGGGVAGSGILLHSGFRTKTTTWPTVAVCGILAGIAQISQQTLTDISLRLMVWRFPIAVVPVWLAWGILAIKERRKGGMGA